MLMNKSIELQPRVIAVILNTNRCGDTLACLASLEKSTYENLTVIVLDNHSTDGSVQAIHSNFPQVQVIELAENQGYAGNNNVGIRAALDQQADWVFVLNEDVILAPDCLERLVATGESESGIGMVGPMVYHYDEPDVIQSAGGWVNRYWVAGHFGKDEKDQGQFNVARPVDWLTGCSILVRRAVVEQIGMLDERFFIYCEEEEWCLRAREANWKLVHVPQAKLWHKGVKRDYRPKPSFTYYSTRNHLLLFAKHHAPLSVWLAAWGQTIRTLTSWTIKPKWRHKHEHRDAMWRGVVDFLRHRWGMYLP
jgi:GT2 family glycosyltransferase